MSQVIFLVTPVKTAGFFISGSGEEPRGACQSANVGLIDGGSNRDAGPVKKRWLEVNSAADATPWLTSSA